MTATRAIPELKLKTSVEKVSIVVLPEGLQSKRKFSCALQCRRFYCNFQQQSRSSLSTVNASPA
jgi:hypothetical protein